ncbi:hypothetical protein IMX26_16485 [Clostridium sp. 'deep sea']|uniref:YcdB/YcdC domain-containing protein n=1 Tax=Clostridium sp. 'deep sea' TaxID=2779445 RepID=UPI0018963FFE|nr:YcdB/YcdC domain-containing protein [Clostridium sp. 'deep sea']QOR35036.1 hypothetical protein IMX26_16485 [Clostridium sp. 'deep sea']
MKKLLSFIIVMILVMSLTITAFAQINTNEATKITEDQAIIKAINFIKTGWNYSINRDEKVTINYKKSYLNIKNDTWDINWTIKNDLHTLYLKVVVNTLTGSIERAVFDKHPIVNCNTQEKCNITTLTEAKDIADNFFKKVNYSIYKQTKYKNYVLDEAYNDLLNYNFAYLRQYNGKWVVSNEVLIEVNANTKEVTSYSCCWDNKAVLKPIKNNMSKDTVKALIEKSLNLQPRYKLVNNKAVTTNKDYIVTYSTTLPNAYAIDAEKGVLIDENGTIRNYEASLDISKQQKEQLFTEVAITNATEPTKKEVANYFINNYLKYFYGSNFKVISTNYVGKKNVLLKQLWHSEFIFTKNDENITGDIYIDALTSQLLYVLLDNPPNIELNDVQWSSCYNKALEVVSKFYPQKFKELNCQQSLINKDHGVFTFTNIINGIEYPYNEISIFINPKDLTVFAFTCNWNDAEKLPNKNIITAKEAFERYLEDYNYELCYAKVNTSKNIDKPTYEYRLVYRMPQNYYFSNIVDAVDGSLLDFNALSTRLIEVHKNISRAQAVTAVVNKLKSALSNNIAELEEPLFLDISRDTKYYQELKFAVNYGLIDNKVVDFNGNEDITRIELAELIIRALKYEKIAKVSSLYKVSFTDSKLIAKDCLGYAAFCDALGIIKSENKRFMPNNPVSDAELAIALCYLYYYYE